MYQGNDIRGLYERTKQNLEAIDNLAGSGGAVWDVTQLVNSLLGLLVFPASQFYKSIDQTPLEALYNSGWPKPRKIAGSLRQDDLRELIRS
jgi:hypothetical protein